MKNEVNIVDRVRAINAKRAATVIQETKPVRESINKDMVQCNFYIHPELKKRLKLRALEEGHGYKEIITEALKKYLK